MNRFKVSGLSFVFLTIIAVLISGCATTALAPIGITMAVDSIAARNAPSKGKTYIIKSAMQNISDKDLEFQEVARYIENALSSKKYIRTDSKENADILIYLGYRMSAPQKSYHTYTNSGAMAMPIGGIWFAKLPTTQTIEITTFITTLILEAYDLKDPNGILQLWKTTTKLGGCSADLRAVLPSMVAASSDYFGTNTGKQISVTIQQDDPKLLNIRK